MMFIFATVPVLEPTIYSPFAKGVMSCSKINFEVSASGAAGTVAVSTRSLPWSSSKRNSSMSP